RGLRPTGRWRPVLLVHLDEARTRRREAIKGCRPRTRRHPHVKVRAGMSAAAGPAKIEFPSNADVGEDSTPAFAHYQRIGHIRASPRFTTTRERSCRSKSSP